MDDFVQTRSSQLKKNAISNFVSVKYEAPKRKIKDDKGRIDDEAKVPSVSSKFGKRPEKELDPRKQQEREMKRARYDVIKFGMSGFQKTEARKAKIALAISLGAKEGKKRRMNYKKLKDIRNAEKVKDQGLQQVSGLSKSLVKHKTEKKLKKKSDGILEVYGKVERVALSKSKR